MTSVHVYMCKYMCKYVHTYIHTNVHTQEYCIHTHLGESILSSSGKVGVCYSWPPRPPVRAEGEVGCRRSPQEVGGGTLREGLGSLWEWGHCVLQSDVSCRRAWSCCEYDCCPSRATTTHKQTYIRTYMYVHMYVA